MNLGIGTLMEASCRKYFDALARKLALYYRFKWGPDDDNDYPTFGDVLYAYKKNEWNFVYRQQIYAERTDGSKQAPVFSIPLPDLKMNG
jgi:hypothetical protein